MLSYGLLKNHAGILLIGDYTSLTWLHEVVHDVNDRSPLVKDKEGSFLGLAYDVRKAYERQREIIKPPKHFEEIGVRYGVQILWPVLMLQQRLLRQSLAFLDHKSHRLCIGGGHRRGIARGFRSAGGAYRRSLAAPRPSSV
ncbi:DUF6904 family protein [Rhizobium sp. 23-156Da]